MSGFKFEALPWTSCMTLCKLCDFYILIFQFKNKDNLKIKYLKQWLAQSKSSVKIVFIMIILTCSHNVNVIKFLILPKSKRLFYNFASITLL